MRVSEWDSPVYVCFYEKILFGAIFKVMFQVWE